jgi:imidazolonepropionase-like amidohydrolase
MEAPMSAIKLFKPLAAGIMGTVAALANDPSTLPPNSEETGTEAPLTLINGHIVDVVRGGILEKGFILIRNGLVEQIGRPVDVVEAIGKTLDLGGRYCIPGLIDAHCHISVSSTFSILPTLGDAVRNYRQIRRQWATSIESGVTSVRDTGSFPIMRRRLEKEVSKGLLKGPRVYSCNSILNVKGSHPDIPPHHINPLSGPASTVMGSIGADFTSDDDLIRALEENLPGASFIKLTVDNRSMFQGKGAIPVYTNRHLKRIFDFAEEHELPVACHCATAWGLRRMLDYPVASFEHVVADELITDKDIGSLTSKNVSVVPTLSVGPAYALQSLINHLPIQYLTDFVMNEIRLAARYLNNIPHSQCDPKIHKASMERMALYGHKVRGLMKKYLYIPDAAGFVQILTTGVRNLLKMKEAGVNIGCGMDAGMPLNYFGALFREIELFERIGFSNLDALRTATINNAKILGREDFLGSIEPGKAADLVIVDKNPLEDLSTLEKPALVMKDGRIFENSFNDIHGC